MEELNLRHYAHLGDAVWEIFVRENIIFKTKKAQELHKLTTSFVNANFQHEMLLSFQSELTEEDQDLIRRARNMPVPIARRSNQSHYRSATAFETLLGYWYLNDRSKLDEFFNKQKKIFEQKS